MSGETTYESQPVWVVTGASKGIGRAVVEAAAASGALVFAGTRDVSLVDAWAAYSEHAARIVPLSLNVTADESVRKATEEVLRRAGRIDVLVNNAGYLLYGGVEELSDAEVRRSFDVNVFAVLSMTRAVLPTMREQGSGRVINLASISANLSSPAIGLYSATKAAVLQLSEALDQEAAPLGVRSIAICPGGVRTDFLDASSARRAEQRIEAYASVHDAEDQLAQGNHQQGGSPAKVAAAILEVARMGEPPSRLYLGTDAVGAIERISRSTIQSVDQHRALSVSIDA